MLLLLLSILSSTSIFLVFKLMTKNNIPILPSIVINYLTASILALFTHDFSIDIRTVFSTAFIITTIVIGILFIAMFFVIAKSSDLTGISKTTTISKMSVILPISFSIIAYHEQLSLSKYIGILLALIAVFLTIYKKQDTVSSPAKNSIWILIILFMGMGGVDISIKFAQDSFVNDEISSLFTGLLFFTAFIVGILLIIPQKTIRHHLFSSSKVWLYGSILGIVNFGTVFFLIATLNSHIFPSSVIFGINNTSIVLLSFLLGLLFFKEPLSKINILGIITSIIAIGILTIT